MEKEWLPPRGISYRFKAGRPSPFILLWRDPETKRQRAEAFDDEEKREAAAKKLADGRANHGKEVLTFDAAEWRLWRQFRDIIGDADPLRVAHEWLAIGRPARSKPVADAVEQYISLREENGFRGDSLSQLRLRLRRFSAAFAGSVHEVEPQHIRDWIKSLISQRSGLPMEAESKHHHLGSVRVFYTWAVAEGLASRNPCDAVHLPARPHRAIAVIPLDQARTLFSVNRDAKCIGRLALEAFGGLRYSTAARVNAECLDLERKALSIPGSIHKSGERHFIDGQPENLWAWLKHAPASCWEMTPRQYLEAKSQAFKDAGIPHPKNILRHSFASYHLAMNKDAGRTAYLLQHRGTAMLYRHYNGGATRADAETYFSIVPA